MKLTATISEPVRLKGAIKEKTRLIATMGVGLINSGIVTLQQWQYDMLEYKNPTTLYFILG